MKRSDLAAGILLFGIPALVAGGIMLNRASAPRDEPPARLDDLIAQCAENGAFDRCDDRVIEVESALKNAATAEESYATVNDGRYTRDIADLEREGLQVPPNVKLRVVGRARDGYCIEGRARGIDGTMHYSSTTGSPEAGSCR